MNSFKDIWNNPDERPDFIIALIVCALFGVGILYFLPQSDRFLTTTGESSTIAAKATTAYAPNPTTVDAQEQNRVYTKTILRDKDVEEGRVGLASKTKKPSPVSKPSSNQVDINSTSTNSGSNNIASNKNAEQTANNSNEDNTGVSKDPLLDSLKTTDFKETEVADDLGKEKPSDLDSLADKNSDESVVIEADKNSTTGDKGDSKDSSKTDASKEVVNVSKDTNSDENSKNESDKNVANSDNTKPKTPANASKPNTDKTSKDDDFNRHIGDCIIVVGAFEKDHNAQKIIRQLKRKGYTVKTGWRKGLKYVGVPTNCKDQKVMNTTLQKLRKTFDIEAWVLRP